MSNFYDDYTAFLESEEWKQMRQKRLAIDNYQCQCCGTHGSTDNHLQVHHLRYDRAGGNEDIFRDLVTVCDRCHTLIHCMMNRVTNEYGRRGWSYSLPTHIQRNLKQRGLML